eukprot:TRINITY_DN7324_c0_g1_i1.p1 TRINITY_DN7324_c0_g1~~TRINITY_DN7324_c0_g1_i1.p1  ORF type:complete len:204 (-),score=108.41 TRINITY_DN7324_c0_g1_i1:103-714(-)
MAGDTPSKRKDKKDTPTKKKRKSIDSVDGEKKKRKKKRSSDAMEVVKKEEVEDVSEEKTETTNKKKRVVLERPKEVEVNVFAVPLADEDLQRRINRLMKNASKEKGLRRGVKEVVKSIRKGEKGLCVIAGDISPIDVISHLPVLCEDSEVTYVYVKSKEELGAAACTKRPTSCVLVSDKGTPEYASSLKKVKKGVVAIAPSFY